MGWTEAQQKVIDTRNKNLLVAAAAGSGKTAVLVERIISMISEGDQPMDIDHLLVVTFTNAAAAEMRGRIGKAIDEKLLKDPENQHLQKQVSLLQSAQITTIHSFCLNVIRNYFHRIDLDPSFKIAEESEITLMKSDVIADLLERWYEEEREDFHAFIESYSYSKSDAPVEDLILQLYNFSMSDPWPKEWLSDKLKMFDIDSLEDIKQADWMKELLHYINVVLGDLLHKNLEALAICHEADGPAAYEAALLSDHSLLESFQHAETYEEYARMFSGISYDRLSSKKEAGVDPGKKEKVKELREEVKKGMKDLVSQYFFQCPEEMLKDLQSVKDVMKVLFELTIEFMEEFAKKKEEKNLLDFNDLEHNALKILVEEITNTDNPEGHEVVRVPSLAALELSELFDEILIDEYQDSNMVQETILQSISRERIGTPNRFMVGDVKQSIYKFRLAMPEIFMEKYGSYSTRDLNEDGVRNLFQRIDLDKNFRSRKVVLDYVNLIFEQIMQEPVGGIVYDEAASLKYGELYEGINENSKEDTNSEVIRSGSYENEADINEGKESTQNADRIADNVELLLVSEEEADNSEDDAADQYASDPTKGNLEGSFAGNTERKSVSISEASSEEDEAAYTKKEIEARVIAKKIRELTDPKRGMLVFDNKTKQNRPATNRDIVILLRSMSGWSEVFVNTLLQEGISAYADTGTGYFQTLEIMTILNLLRIIDNPRQDIPLVGVLYSPVVGLSTTELALIRAANRNISMYSAVLHYTEGGSEEELKQKLQNFLTKLEQFRSMVNYKPIHELIQFIIDETGYYYYVSAMPGGDRRKANIDMLISQAVRFEKGSYSGLFHFIRYIEKLHKYEVDFGEAATSGEQGDTVRIMSIHKSKGLEFPIVFVAGMSKQFNTQDLRNKIVLHSEYGVGPEYIDSKLRTKVPTLLKKVIQRKIQIENLGEELRVLYVALTRAREKLIMTGYLKGKDEIKNKDFSFFELMSAKSYLDWVLPAMVNRMGRKPDLGEKSLTWDKDILSISIIHKDDLLMEELVKQTFLQKDKEELLSIDPDTVYNQELKEEIKARVGFEYPYQKEAMLRIKMTVSELKKLGQFIDEEQSENLYEKPIKTVGTEPANGEKLDQSVPEEANLKQPAVLTPTEPYEFKVNPTEPYEFKISPIEPDELEFNPTEPNFIQGKEAKVTGTDRGTLYHRVLELLDLTKVLDKEDLQKELDCLIQQGKLRAIDIKLLRMDYLTQFIQSDVADRMRKAQSLGKLYKEKQFVIGIKASEVMKEVDTEELILIQGIIDVFFEEDGELVLLDYKSDIVPNEELLIKRYKVQLDYYKKALEQMQKCKVKDMIIYSLYLGKEIRIE